jgi:antitoxin ParD1/3/4
MTIRLDLTPEQNAWLAARVAAGEFPSIEVAAQQAIAESMQRDAAQVDNDLAWAKPLVDEAIAEIERGELISLDEHLARTKSRLARFGA